MRSPDSSTRTALISLLGPAFVAGVAYLDPGTGSIILQAIIAAVISWWFYARKGAETPC